MPRLRPRQASTALAFLLLLTPFADLFAQVFISEISGIVQVSKNSGSSWAGVPKTPWPLVEGDTVYTARESQATVLFSDRSMVKLGPTAQFTLSNATKDKAEITLIIGTVHAWIQKALSQHFKVRTPTAVCAVRGTEFQVEVNERREMNVDVVSGVVAVKTVLGEEVELGDGRALRSLRVIPEERLNLPKAEKAAAKQKEKEAKAPAEVKVVKSDKATANDEFTRDLRGEVGLGLSKDAVQAAAAVESRRAEYMEGKTMVDVFGKRVRIEEYILRPAPDQFKFVVLNNRPDRFDYFYYQARFNQNLPPVLSSALQFLNGKTGAAPGFFITAFETGRSNTTDTIQENGTGGHLVNAPLTADKFAYDSVSNTFTTIKAGTPFWSTLFDNYSYKIDGTEKFGWQPVAGVVGITAYDYVATGFNTRILGGGAMCGAAGCATAGPVTCTALACENAARPATISTPDGASNLHQRVVINYAGNGTAETYDFFIVGDAGNLATAADFNGNTSGAAYQNTLLKFNFEQAISASEFGGRKIDLVVEPKILINSGVIQ